MKKRLFLILILLLFFIKEGSAFPRFIPVETQEAGIGAWQEMPFGQMRILSCSSGVKDLAMVVGGLQIRLEPDWTMKKPLLKPLVDQYPSWIELPVRPGDGRSPIYKGEVLIPLIYTRDPNEQAPFDLGVQGELPVCQNDQCLTLPIRISLPLSETEAEYTTACAYLIEQQRQIPWPAKARHIQGYAWQSDGKITFVFNGVKKAQIAFLQTLLQSPFHVLETRLEENGIMMEVQTQPWEIGQTQEWVLISDQGIFKVPVIMQNQAVSLSAPSISWKIGLLGGELFFLTPLFIWWGLGIKKNKKTWQKEIRQFILFSPFVFVLRAFLNEMIPFDMVGYTLLILGITCLFPPQKPITALLLFFLWPYFPTLPPLSMGLFITWLIGTWLQMMLPFVLLYFSAKELGKILRDAKQKSFFVYNFIFLLPTVILLGGTIWYNMHKSPTYLNALNTDGFSVMCAQKECISWQKETNIHFIDPESALGKKLQKSYKHSQAVIWQSDGERVILPPDTSVKKAYFFKKNWQNYRAQRMP